MSDDQKPLSRKLHESTPVLKQVVRLITATTFGAALLGLSAIILTGMVVSLILATPVLVIFSPILVPAAALLFLITVGFLFSGACVLAAIASLRWTYNYVTGKNLSGAEQLEVTDMEEKAKEYGQSVHREAREP